MIYLRKLIALFPDEPTRELFYARDFLAPRFFYSTLRDYKAALRDGTAEQVLITHQDLRFVVGLHRLRVRIALIPVLQLLRYAPLARGFFRITFTKSGSVNPFFHPFFKVKLANNPTGYNSNG